ncbi:hypothetical protein JKP88DRAFT_348454 [Tribonema minus]|uniref:Cytidyltransferase-like domain-containing protein n=1 Tax=Tribonema minus TaxID=303371 RepID=A0A836CF87_9STRA|nr:hypothetical protein JKP88DRAFT_348454 [Tribonema minus]
MPNPPQLCLSTTGAGGQAVAWLLGVPGASATLLEATVPYSPLSGRQWMGGAAAAPTSLCSEEAAIAMAREAYKRALQLTVAERGLARAAAACALGVGATAAVASTRPKRGDHRWDGGGARCVRGAGVPVHACLVAVGVVVIDQAYVGAACALGVGATAALASTQPKRGDHRCHVAACGAAGTTLYSLTLAKGRRDRAGEDAVVSRLVLRAVLEPPEAFLRAALLLDGGGASSSGSAPQPPEAVPAARHTAPPDALDRLLAGHIGQVLVLPGGANGEVDAAAAATAEDAAAAAAAADDAAAADAEGAARGGGEPSAADAAAARLRSAGSGEQARRAEGGAAAAAGGGVQMMFPELPVPAPALVFPGSFNPLHNGHVALVQAAQACYARTQADSSAGSSGGGGSADVGSDAAAAAHHPLPVLFELSVANADKGALPRAELLRRVAQFAGGGGATLGAQYAVALTAAPLFLQKARLFPGCVFVVGVDTVRRILDPKYYADGDAAEMAAALAEIKYLGCRIIVGGRVQQAASPQASAAQQQQQRQQNGFDEQQHAPQEAPPQQQQQQPRQQQRRQRFETLSDVLRDSPLPQSLRGMFIGLEEDDFRVDLSSTELRAKAAAAAARKRAAAMRRVSADDGALPHER